MPNSAYGHAGASSPTPPAMLGWVFLRLGAVAFGGLGATLALIERELVSKRHLLTAADLTEALTYTKLLPGSTGPQVVAYLGYKLGGWLGSACATAAFLLPAALLMVVLAWAYTTVTALPMLGPAINGLAAAVVGLVLATTYSLGKANIKNRRMLGLAVAALVSGAWLGLHAAVIVVAAGLLGLVLHALPRAYTASAPEEQP